MKGLDVLLTGAETETDVGLRARSLISLIVKGGGFHLHNLLVYFVFSGVGGREGSGSGSGEWIEWMNEWIPGADGEAGWIDCI